MPSRISPRPGKAIRTFKRLLQHLTRRAARWGYFVVLSCSLVYNSVPESWGIAQTLREFLLILASVAAAAILLPDLPSNLWSLDVERVRNLIPERQRENLARTLISAESDDARWSKLVWSRGLAPLTKASRDPWEHTHDMDYDVTVHLNRPLSFGDAKLPVHSVSVNQKSFRVLDRPSIKTAWLSIARTSTSINREFLEPACLARELVPFGDLVGAEWQDAILATCQVELFIDGTRVDLIAEALRDLPDIVRWRLPAEFEMTPARMRLHMRFDYHLAPETDSFPVIFAGYYCAGNTSISMRLYDEHQLSTLECDYFLGQMLDPGSAGGTTETSNGVYKQITFSTGKESILWPGSGVMFRWRPQA